MVTKVRLLTLLALLKGFEEISAYLPSINFTGS